MPLLPSGRISRKPRLDPPGNEDEHRSWRSALQRFQRPARLLPSLEIKQFDEATPRQTTSSSRSSRAAFGRSPRTATTRLTPNRSSRPSPRRSADLKIIGVAAKDNKEHDLYGVNDPDKAEVGTKGVGTLIAMQDGKGNDLLRMIVGKEVANAPNQRFVRKPSEDRVYVTSIDMAKLPTDFEKWIEKDLLKLSTFDVNRVHIKDYLVLPTSRGQHAARSAHGCGPGLRQQQGRMEGRRA